MMESCNEMIDGQDFRRMIDGAYRAFIREYEYINSLNVFPVPDGDTGTNMMLTMQTAARTLVSAPDTGIGPLSKRVADSAIMGARGNSGVILSQIFRGIARGLAGKQEATSSEIGKAFQYGILYAYRAVARPVEGTILTVAKGIAKGAHHAVRDNKPLVDILSEAIAAGREELKRTPELLPALKSAGVVDAGGQGLIAFLSGCAEGLSGECFSPESNFESTVVPSGYLPEGEQPSITHPYCTEFIIQPCSITLEDAKKLLIPCGESLVMAPGGDFLKVHIHSAHPGLVLEQALTWGTIHNIKIDNMADQHRHQVITHQAKKLEVISVASGDGIKKIMEELGAAAIIDGGQTMNPPVEQFVAAVHRGHAERYILLPNNKNIILAVAQAKKLLGDRLEMIATTNIPQGLAALTAFQEEASLEDNLARMQEAVNLVRSGSITQAVRDSLIDAEMVKAGSYIGVLAGKVVNHALTLGTALIDLTKKLVDAEASVVSVYYGEEVLLPEAQQIAHDLAETLPDVEIELYAGGQANYHFFVSVE
ncbi:DAK2 domain fusion protein YloV [Sporomusaceae bacterium BoRhaA]|uniref:DAK2 domain-containing protein n=1 Tax=Pelorhabdus rhamnosifermentans TaxID=2772457 RepID=UPI001FE6583F|nr:DAK2 domain-containing protein [Pelorhabdus rhamnosifermentans]MBU2702521.1 DAK2 domain fusion protein YloV [Pelorhabdus rhamnosifermentans]